MAIGAPQFQQRLPFVDEKRLLTNDALQVLNDAFASQQLLIEQLATVIGLDIPGLAAAAQAAQDAADNANAAAAAVTADSSLATSGVSGMTMTATDAGANATITISAHTRIYGDGTSVAVSGGNILALAYSTAYYVYYSDPSRAGGAVTFLASTDPDDAVQAGAVHSLGAVMTPAAAGPPNDGNPNLPPGVEQP